MAHMQLCEAVVDTPLPPLHALPPARYDGCKTCQDVLTHRGGIFKVADPWAVTVCKSGEDGRLLTGQNPPSAAPLAAAVVDAVKGLAK